jgi:hypothetical protein
MPFLRRVSNHHVAQFPHMASVCADRECFAGIERDVVTVLASHSRIESLHNPELCDAESRRNAVTALAAVVRDAFESRRYGCSGFLQ